MNEYINKSLEKNTGKLSATDQGADDSLTSSGLSDDLLSDDDIFAGLSDAERERKEDELYAQRKLAEEKAPVSLRPGSLAGLGYEIDPELLQGRTDKLLREFGPEEEEPSSILLAGQEESETPEAFSGGFSGISGQPASSVDDFSDPFSPSASTVSVSSASDYSYSPDEQNSSRGSFFSASAYDLSNEQEMEADCDPQLGKLLDDSAALIPWRTEKPSLGTGIPLQLGVIHGEEVLESEDPFFLKDFLKNGEDPDAATAKSDCQAEVDSGAEVEPAEYKNTALVIGVKFRQYGPVYFFTTGKNKVRAGASVLVETEQGIGLVDVVIVRRLRLPLPPLRTAEGAEVIIQEIKGLATSKDIAAASDNKVMASSAFMHCKECIRERSLEMKLVDVEVLHDRSKIVFYFTAPARIDFRELVKDLVRAYRTRIELRQIGVRHETQMLGALGNCGMACCCRRYLRRFAPVTIKMAKEQNLFLNPAKLSGVCGRLLCCLSYEQENYEEFHRRCPKAGKKYQTSAGPVKVLRANLFRQCITILTEMNEEVEYTIDDWQELAPQRMDIQDSPGSHTPQGHTSDSADKVGAKSDSRTDSRSDSRPDSGPGQRPYGKKPDRAVEQGAKPKPRYDAGSPDSGVNVNHLDDPLDIDPRTILPEDSFHGGFISLPEEDEEDLDEGSIFGLSKPKPAQPSNQSNNQSGSQHTNAQHQQNRPSRHNHGHAPHQQGQHNQAGQHASQSSHAEGQRQDRPNFPRGKGRGRNS